MASPGTGCPSTAPETSLRDQLIDAWHRADVDALTRLMATDAVLSMPPDPIRRDGPAAVIGLLGGRAPEGRLDRYALVPIAMNRQPSVILHLPDETGRYVASGVVTLDIAGQRIQRMTAFRLPASFVA